MICIIIEDNNFSLEKNKKLIPHLDNKRKYKTLKLYVNLCKTLKLYVKIVTTGKQYLNWSFRPIFKREKQFCNGAITI